MPLPILFAKDITKKRIVEEIEAIEAETKPDHNHISSDGIKMLRELRIALESKPVVDSVQ